MTVLAEPAPKINNHVVKSCIKDALRYLEDYELPESDVTRHLRVRGYDAHTIEAALARAAMERRVARSRDHQLVRSLVAHV